MNLNPKLTEEYMNNHLESIKQYGKDVHFVINSLLAEVSDFDKRITKMAQENKTNDKLYDELQELRELSLSSINSWRTML